MPILSNSPEMWVAYLLMVAFLIKRPKTIKELVKLFSQRRQSKQKE